MESRFSPIDKIRIKDFRNLGDVTISFAESPIVSLIGENESGKTSIIKAIGVCAMNSDFRYQKEFVRSGTSGFIVGIWLQDGNVVLRSKAAAYNKYTLLIDGQKSEIPKIDANLPPVVQRIMGLIEEPETKELLHIRTYEDQLLFVVTPNSTNYKVMYDALKVSEITQAIKLGNQEVNELKARISRNMTGAESMNQALEGISIYDLKPLQNIRDKVVFEGGLVGRLHRTWGKICELNRLKSLDSIVNYDVKPINEVLAGTLNRVTEMMVSLRHMKAMQDGLAEVEGLSEIETRTAEKLDSAANAIKGLQAKKNELSEIERVAEMQPINPNLVSRLSQTTDLVHRLDTMKAELSILESESPKEIEQEDLNKAIKIIALVNHINSYKEVKSRLEAFEREAENISNKLVELGVKTTQCPNCGEIIILEE